MIRILIVEDEPPILRSILSAVRACGEEYRVESTAFNGKAAWDYLCTQQNAGTSIDLVITDIRMPLMSGLELAENIYSGMPETKVVVLSGYEDFSYVQRALRSKVLDYLTKPVFPEALRKVLEQVDAETARRKEEEYTSMLREATENRAIPENESKKYALFLLCAGAFPLTPDDSFLPGRQIWLTQDLQALLKPWLPVGESYFCFEGKTACEQMLVVETSTLSHINDIKWNLFSICEKLPLFTSCIYSHKLYHVQEFNDTFASMRVKLQKEILLLKMSFLEDIQPMMPAAPLPVPLREALLDALHSGNRTVLGNTLRACVDSLIASDTTQAQALHFFKDILRELQQILHLSDNDVIAYSYDIDEAVSNAESPAGFCESLRQIFTLVLEKRAEKSSEPPVIAEIEKYLKQHYAEDMTNTSLAAVFGFVPSYLSSLFRRYREISPSEYLTRYRIRLAIEYIHDHPEARLKEAAVSVGIRDPYYFSKLFKKVTGLCPSEYFSQIS